MANDFDEVLRGRAARESTVARKAQDILEARARNVRNVGNSVYHVESTIGRGPEDNSWTTALTLDPASVLGGSVNLAARGVSGASRMLGNIATAGIDAASMWVDNSLPPGAIEAYNRYTKSQTSPEDLLQLKDPNSELIKSFQKIEGSKALRERAQSIAETMDVSGIVNTDVGNQLQKSAENIYDNGVAQVRQALVDLGGNQAPEGESAWGATKRLASGAYNLVAGGVNTAAQVGHAALTNKQAILEQIVENAPQVAAASLGPVGHVLAGAANLGYGAENYRKGMEEFSKQNNGQLPSESQVSHMRNMALAAAAAEHAGDVFQLGMARAASSLGKTAGAVATAAADAAKDSRTSFKKALLNTGKAAGASFAEEAATEAFQTYAENEAQLKDTSGKEMFSSGLIGGFSGAGISGPTRLAGEAKELLKQSAAESKKNPGSTAPLKGADIEKHLPGMMDPASETYNPRRALATLHAQAAEQTTTPEKRAELEQQAGALVMAHDNEIEKLSAQIPADRSTLEEQLQAAKEARAQLPEDASESQTALLDGQVERLTEALSKPVLEGKELADAVEKRTKMEEQRDKLYSQLDRLTQYNEKRAELESAQQTPTTVEGSTDPVADLSDAKTVIAEDADQATVEKAQSAAQRLFTRAMAAPDDLSHEDALAVAENTSNGLNEAQRKYFRTLSESQVARNALKSIGEVSDEVLYGNTKKNQVGIETYRSRVSAALRAGNVPLVDSTLAMLGRFAEGHQSKFEAMSSALKKAKETGEAVQLVRMDDGQWHVSDRTLTQEELKKHQGMRVDANSGKLVTQIGAEAKALLAAREELRAAREAHLSPVAKPTKAATPNTSTAGEAVKASAEAAPSPKPETAKPAGVEEKKAPKVQEPIKEAPQPDQPASLVSPKEEKAPQVEANPADSSVEGELQSVFPDAPKEEAKKEEPQKEGLAQEAAADGKITEEAIKANPKAGELSAMSTEQKDKDGKPLPYQKANLIGRNLTQNPQGKLNGTFRPLVAVKDFLSQVKAGKVAVESFLPKDKHGDLGEHSPKAILLKTFIEQAGEWADRFNQNLMVKRGKNDTNENTQAAFFFNDMVQFLIQVADLDGKEKLHLEENLSTAMSFGAWTYLAEMGSRPLYNSPEEINSILRRSEDHPVSGAEMAALANIGVRGSTLYNSIGQKVTDALGLKLKKDAPLGDLARLQAALGAHVVKMLTDVPSSKDAGGPYLERVTMDKDLQEILKMTGSHEEVFYRPLLDAKGKPVPDIQRIIDTTKGSQGLLNDLFSVESGVLAPTFEPQKFTQKLAKNSVFKVPKFLAKALEHAQNQASRVREDYWHLFSMTDAQGKALFSPEMLMEMNGWKEPDEFTLSLGMLPLQAKNDAIERSIFNFMDFVREYVEPREEGLASPLYFQHEVWKQQRVGIKTNLINPQADKFHRGMLTRDAWTSEIHSDNEAELNSLRLRISEGLGVKTDRVSNETALKGFKDLFHVSPGMSTKDAEKVRKLQAALRALVSSLKGEALTSADAEAIIAGVKAGGEKMHSLDALMAMAEWSYAAGNANGKPYSFKAQITSEVDGVTNGPILSQLAFGAATSAQKLLSLLERGGIYRMGSAFKNFNLWKAEDGHNDLYENTIVHALTESLAANGNLTTEDHLKAIQVITGDLMKDGKATKAGRNIIKTPLTAFNFGSSPFRAVTSMAEGFIEKFYEKLEDTTRDGKDIAPLVQAMNVLVPGLLPRNITFDEFNQRNRGQGFTAREQDQIIKAFRDSLGMLVRETLSTEFGEFNTRRNAMNRAAALSHALYSAIYQTARKEYVANLAASGKLVRDKAGNPLHDLNQEQEAGLQKFLSKVLPVVATPMSLMDPGTDSGVPVTKTSTAVSLDNTYANTTNFGQKTAWGTASILARGKQPVMEAPGKAMPPLTMHSLDSAASHAGVLEGNVLNVHDAHITGALSTLDTARNLNKGAWDALVKYSPLRAMLVSAERTIEGLASIMEGKRLPAGAKDAFWQAIAPTVTEIAKENIPGYAKLKKEDKSKALQQELLDPKYSDPFSLILDFLREHAKEADRVRLETLSQVQAFDQYASEGGQADITDAQREEAAKELAQLDETYAEAHQNKGATSRVLELVSGKRSEENLAPLTAEVADKQAQGQDDMLNALLTDEELEEKYGQDPIPDPKARSTSRAGSLEVLKEVVNSPDVPERVKKDAEVLVERLQESNDFDTNTQAEGLTGELKGLLSKASRAIGAPEWAALGTSSTTPTAWLVDLFKEEKVLPASQVMQTMLEVIERGPATPWRKAQMLLVKQLQQVLPESLKITYITKDTAWDTLGHLPATAACGWFAPHPDRLGDGGIYLLGAEFKKSALTPQILIHELVHAATLDAMRSTESAVVARVNELRKVLAAARAFIAKDPKLAKQYAYATSNLDELVAYGMSNQTFQRDVLDRITITPNSKTGTLSRALAGTKAFLETLTGLMFRNKELDQKERDLATNGLAALIKNTSEILSQKAAEPSRTARVVRAMVSDGKVELDPLNQLEQLTPEDLLYSMQKKSQAGHLTEAFRDQMANALRSALRVGGLSLYKTEKDHIQEQGTVAYNALEAWAKALDTGEAPFASEVAASPFKTSDAELYVIQHAQLAVKALLDTPEASATPHVRELHRIYREARQQLKPSDFDSQEQYDFLFKLPDSTNGRNDYLSRFAALALGHQEVASRLEISARDRSEARLTTLKDRVLTWFKDAMDWVHDRLAGVSNDTTMQSRIAHLTEQMADIHAKNRSKLANASPTSKFAELEAKVTELANTVRDKAMEAAKSDWVKNKANGYVRGAAGITRIVVGEHGKVVLDTLQNARDKALKDRADWVTGLMNEVRGVPATIQALIRQAKHIEKQRMQYIEDVAGAALDAFKDHSEDHLPMPSEGAYSSSVLTNEKQQRALTKIFLKTGMHSLLDTLSMADIAKLIEDPQALESSIRKEIGALSQHRGLANYYVFQAKALGYFKATGRVRGPMLMLNASNIAQLFGTGREHGLQAGELAKVTKGIDTLATLYALKYSSSQDLALTSQILAQEKTRKDGKNGVETVMRLHNMLEQESRERLFEGSEALMIKGFVPDIFNPQTALEVAYSEDQAQALRELGYTTEEHLQTSLDPDDPNRNKGQIFVLRDGGLLPRVTGAIAQRNMKAKGSFRDGVEVAGVPTPGLEDVSRHETITRQRMVQMNDLFRGNPGWDPRKDTQSRMAPTVNANGEVVAWRYLMEDSTKETLLEQDTRFDQVLGTLAGSVVDKSIATEQNVEVLQALKDIYTAEYSKFPDSFVEISASSNNPEMREIYRLLPDATKAQLEKVWGKNQPMMVQYAMLHPVFGYRKWSLSSSFDKKNRNRQADLHGEVRNTDDKLNTMEELFTNTVEQILRMVARQRGMTPEQEETYSRRGAVMVRRAENVWQALVRTAKDIIVVKSISVMWGNIRDNIGMLVLKGITDPRELIRSHVVAIQGALAYKRDRAELSQLQIQRRSETFTGDVKEVDARIQMLEDQLARNPVMELINAGLMPTIAEDINPRDDIYSYKSRFDRTVEGYSEKLHPGVRTVAKNLLMTHDTKAYQVLSDITQISDFVARYTLYKHRTENQANPISKAEAIQEAEETFVNYDTPMHPGLQYLDDHGFMMFTKYFFRIQRVLMKLTKEQPMRVLLLSLANHYFRGLPMPTHSSIIYKFGNNPFSLGAGELPGAMGELATIKAMKLLF